jgi:hypothetical protein
MISQNNYANNYNQNRNQRGGNPPLSNFIFGALANSNSKFKSEPEDTATSSEEPMKHPFTAQQPNQTLSETSANPSETSANFAQTSADPSETSANFAQTSDNYANHSETSITSATSDENNVPPKQPVMTGTSFNNLGNLNYKESTKLAKKAFDNAAAKVENIRNNPQKALLAMQNSMTESFRQVNSEQMRTDMKKEMNDMLKSVTDTNPRKALDSAWRTVQEEANSNLKNGALLLQQKFPQASASINTVFAKIQTGTPVMKDSLMQSMKDAFQQVPLDRRAEMKELMNKVLVLRSDAQSVLNDAWTSMQSVGQMTSKKMWNADKNEREFNLESGKLLLQQRFPQVMPFMNSILLGLQSGKPVMKDSLMTPLKNALEKVHPDQYDEMIKLMSKALVMRSDAQSALNDAWTSLKSQQPVVKTAFTNAWTDVKSQKPVVKTAFTNAWTGTSKFMQQLTEKIKEKVQGKQDARARYEAIINNADEVLDNGQSILHVTAMITPNEPLDKESIDFLNNALTNCKNKVNCINKKDNNGFTPVHYAYESEYRTEPNTYMLRFLFDNGASEEIPDPMGNVVQDTRKNKSGSLLEQMTAKQSGGRWGEMDTPIDPKFLAAMRNETDSHSYNGNMHGGSNNSDNKYVDNIIKMFDMDISSADSVHMVGGSNKKSKTMVPDPDNNSSSDSDDNNSYMKISKQFNKTGGSKKYKSRPVEGTRNIYYNLSSLLDSEYGFERPFDPKAEELHKETIDKIKELTGADEPTVKIYKATLWKMAKDEATKRKEAGERVDNVEKSKIMLKMVTSKILDTIGPKSKPFKETKEAIEQRMRDKDMREDNRSKNEDKDTGDESTEKIIKKGRKKNTNEAFKGKPSSTNEAFKGKKNSRTKTKKSKKAY